MKMTKGNIIELLNIWGLSCLLGAIHLMTLAFVSIFVQGYFVAIEGSSFILGIELFILVPSAIGYFIFLAYDKILRLGDEG